MVNKGVNMNKYKGTQTEKNLEAAFAGESQANILILHQLQKKRLMSKLLRFSQKLLTTKKNTQKCG